MSAPGAEDKLLSVLGLCARARKLVTGTPMICEAMRASSCGTPRRGGKSSVLAVVEAADTSANTHGRLASKCAYYQKPLYRLPATTEELAHAIGKSAAVAAVGVTDPDLLRALTPNLPAPEPLPERPADS